jgi:glycerol uptake facilitator protein
MAEQGMQPRRGIHSRAGFRANGGAVEESGAKEPEAKRTVADEATEDAAAVAVTGEIPARGPAAYVAEFIGTFTLVLFITLAVSQFVKNPISQGPGLPTFQPFIDFSVIGLVHVFALFMLIQTLAVVSGAHFNPAITVALAAIRQIRPIDGAIYVVVQLAGGVLGALITKLILHNFDSAKQVHYGAVKVSQNLDHSIGLGMLVEGLGTFFLVWAVVGVAVNPQAFKEWAGLVIGGTLGLVVMVTAPLTGAGINPARSFGPDLVANAFDGGGRFLLVYAIAPVIGGVLAAVVYMRMFVLPGKKGLFGMGPVG